MGYVSVKWQTPSFVTYANEREHLQAMTPAALAWAKRFVGLTLTGASGSTSTPQAAWAEVRAHQEEFQRLLDALIAGCPTQEQMQGFTEHLRHVQPTRRWDGWPDQVRKQAAQRGDTPENWEGLRQTMLAKGYSDIGGHRPRQPPSRYVQSINGRDALDGLYVELDEFLAKGGQSRLRKCPQCGRYFVQATARMQTYCMTSCQQQANLTKARKNAAYQRTYRATRRERQNKADLQRVHEFIQTFKATRGVSSMLEDVLEGLHMGRRRWNTLVNWEIEHYGHPQATDLTA